MPTSVILPELGESVTDATISRWLRFPGDLVEEGDPLVEISTDKVDTEVSAPASGRLSAVYAEEGDVLAIGAALASINEVAADETVATPPPPTPAAATAAVTDPSAIKPYVTPLVRRLASDLGVNLAEVKGSGIGNRIRKSDVLAAVSAAKGTSAAAAQQNSYLSPLVSLKINRCGLDISSLRGSGRNSRIRLADLPLQQDNSTVVAARSDRTEKLSRLRSTIAARMVESLQTSAQLTTVVEVDVTDINRLRKHFGPAFANANGVKLGFTSFFLRAVTDILVDFPALNASINTAEGTVTYHGGIHLNLAVDTERGLYAPVIRDADKADITQIARATADLAQRARANALTADDLTSGTFTVTNTGSRGALFDTPIINQPQVAILGTGAVVARATVVRDEHGSESVDIRSMSYLSLTYDHRLIDGADAARFLCAVKARIEAADFRSELNNATGLPAGG
ncbi:2-oxo acid dehydrogenase subunit E2 [Mycobacterium sp. NPDC003449]